MADPAPESDAPAQTFASEDGVPNVRARVLGGATSINAGFYLRAHPDWFRAHGEVETMVKADRSGNPIKRTRLVITNANVDIIGPEFGKIINMFIEKKNVGMRVLRSLTSTIGFHLLIGLSFASTSATLSNYHRSIHLRSQMMGQL